MNACVKTWYYHNDYNDYYYLSIQYTKEWLSLSRTRHEQRLNKDYWKNKNQNIKTKNIIGYDSLGG